MSLNLKYYLDVNDLLDKRISIEESLGKLCVTNAGELALYVDEDDLEEPCPSLVSEESVDEKVSEDYQLVGNMDDIKNQLLDTFAKDFHKSKFFMVMSDLIDKKKMTDILTQDVGRSGSMLEAIRDKVDMLDVDSDSIHQSIKDIEDKLIEFENQSKCDCNCNCDKETDDEFEWNHDAFLQCSNSKGIFVKINKDGKLERADINSLVIGVTATDKKKTKVIFSGLCTVTDNGKNQVTKRCSVKNGIAIVGTHFNIIERIDSDTIKIILK